MGGLGIIPCIAKFLPGSARESSHVFRPRMKVDAEAGLCRTAQEVVGSIPTKGATLFSVLSDMIAICQAK